MKVCKAFDTEGAQSMTFQAPFPATTKCCRCKEESRLAFVAHELYNKKKDKSICKIWQTNGKKDLWLHDNCAVAVYFCRKCLEPTALYNQA